MSKLVEHWYVFPGRPLQRRRQQTLLAAAFRDMAAYAPWAASLSKAPTDTLEGVVGGEMLLAKSLRVAGDLPNLPVQPCIRLCFAACLGPMPVRVLPHFCTSAGVALTLPLSCQVHMSDARVLPHGITRTLDT
jgi:hypothetical protein